MVLILLYFYSMSLKMCGMNERKPEWLIYGNKEKNGTNEAGNVGAKICKAL